MRIIIIQLFCIIFTFVKLIQWKKVESIANF